MDKPSKRTLLMLIAGTLILGGALYVLWKYGTSSWLDSLLNEKIDPVLFVVLMAVLPSVGFPISVFLIVAGAKFGLAGGFFITALAIPIHLSISYFIGNSMFRGGLQRYLSKKNYQLPEVPQDKMVPWALVFVAIPSIPYAVKNYLLALVDIPPLYYFAINWPVNLVLSIPFLGIGESAVRMNLWLFFLFVVLLLLGYALTLWLKKRYGHMID
jgi:uncharacterized membrane protein YdjX (TVP38/TMEM64 family)